MNKKSILYLCSFLVTILSLCFVINYLERPKSLSLEMIFGLSSGNGWSSYGPYTRSDFDESITPILRSEWSTFPIEYQSNPITTLSYISGTKEDVEIVLKLLEISLNYEYSATDVMKSHYHEQSARECYLALARMTYFGSSAARNAIEEYSDIEYWQDHKMKSIKHWSSWQFELWAILSYLYEQSEGMAPQDNVQRILKDLEAAGYVLKSGPRSSIENIPNSLEEMLFVREEGKSRNDAERIFSRFFTARESYQPPSRDALINRANDYARFKLFPIVAQMPLDIREDRVPFPNLEFIWHILTDDIRIKERNSELRKESRIWFFSMLKNSEEFSVSQMLNNILADGVPLLEIENYHGIERDVLIEAAISALPLQLSALAEIDFEHTHLLDKIAFDEESGDVWIATVVTPQERIRDERLCTPNAYLLKSGQLRRNHFTFSQGGDLVIFLRRINGEWFWNPFGW